MEQWKDIDGHPGYQVSDKGRVRSFINNRYGMGTKSHILKPVETDKGYCSVQLGRKNRHSIHRLVATAFVPNPAGLPLVRHADDNPRNNNATNLKWGTQTDNMQDCVRHNRLVGDTRAAVESKRKQVMAITIDGSTEQIYESVQEAARQLELWPQHVSSAARGKISQTGGYKFRFIEEGEDI